LTIEHFRAPPRGGREQCLGRACPGPNVAGQNSRTNLTGITETISRTSAAGGVAVAVGAGKFAPHALRCDAILARPRPSGQASPNHRSGRARVIIEWHTHVYRPEEAADG